MRLLPTLLLLVTAASLTALPRLQQPDGRSVWLFARMNDGAVTLTFPAGAVPEESWLTLRRTTGPAWVEWAGPEGRSRLVVPDVRIPGLVTAVRVPKNLKTLVWHGRLPAELVLARMPADAPPGAPARLLIAPDETVVGLPAWTAPARATDVITVGLRAGTPTSLSWEGTKPLERRLSGREGGWNFYPDAWGFRPQVLRVTGAGALESLRVRAVPDDAPLPADPGTVLAWPRDRWRNPKREWFAWSGTSVLVLVTADYRTQDAYLRRLAFFVEKTGYRGRVVSDRELGNQHGWNAHDYAATDLAAFFTQAAADRFELLPQETELRERLVASGILKTAGTGVWSPGTGALVGISAESPPALREALFVHEGFHGLYFTSPEFREGTAAVWSGLSEGARQAFRSFLARSAYDPTFEALMVNEFQAYVLQRDEAGWEPFFRDRVLADGPAGARKLGWLTELLGAARTLDGLVGTLYGLQSGSITTVRKP